MAARRDSAKLRSQKQRADEAARIMSNELVQEAFSSIEEVIENGWKESGGADAEARERAYLMHRLFRQFKNRFERIMVKGAEAATLLEKIE